MAMKVAHKFDCIFENRDQQELIYVMYEDLDGYIHYWYCDDPTQQEYKMTKAQLYRDHERMHS